MKCYNCRAEVTENVNFCIKCGSPQKFTDFVRRALNNDQDATAQLYKMTYNNVYQTICMTASLDNDVVFDLIQDTYIKAFRNLSQLNEPEAFRGWIKIIARNLTIDHLRKRKVVNFSQMVSVDSDEMIEFEDDRTENLPEVVTDQKETTRLMQEILGGLSEEQRLVVSMYYFEELSVKEIADILSVSEGTVKSRLNYARKNIEVGVKELEKKGTKLYGLAPVPFLLLLFRSQDVYAAEMPNSMVLQNVQENLSSITSSAHNGSTAQKLGEESAKTIGKEAAKTTVKVAGKSIITKVIAGVAIVVTVGAGIFGISSMNKEEENNPENVEQEIVTETTEKVEFDLQDFRGMYYCGDYFLKLSFYDGSRLSISSGVNYKGRTTIVYHCDEFLIEGNTLIGKYSEKGATPLQDYGTGEMLNEDGSKRDKPQEGTDTFILNEDGTLTANFEGIVGERGRSGVYHKEGTVPIPETELDDFLTGYVGDEYFCMLTYENGILSVGSGTMMGELMYGYGYEEFQIEGNTLKATYKDYDESGELVELTDTYQLEVNCSMIATFSGFMDIRSGEYFKYGGEGSVLDYIN